MFIAFLPKLLVLLTLHHIADVGLQPSWLIESKKKHLFSIYEHAFVWAGLISIGLMYFSLFTWGKFLFLLVGHIVIDYLKYKTTDYRWTYLDQALHYLQIILVL